LIHANILDQNLKPEINHRLVIVETHERMGLVSAVISGEVSGNPVVHYIGIDPGNHLPLMITLDSRDRHWLTDGTRSTVVYPAVRDNSGVGAVTFTYDYTVDRATSLLSTVEPIKTKELPLPDGAIASAGYLRNR
jgi:hypothetical protein